MVAKLMGQQIAQEKGYLLAKIHMVAKPNIPIKLLASCYLLAKIHMVAKLFRVATVCCHRYLLAKIHMVAKPQTDFIT